MFHELKKFFLFSEEAAEAKGEEFLIYRAGAVNYQLLKIQ
jgi:hypothetical protein